MPNTSAREVDLGFTHDHFPAGTHMCLVYSSETERQRIISAFLGAGVRDRECVAYFADKPSVGEAEAHLAAMGCQTEPAASGAGVSVTVAETTYCPHGTFIPEEMLATLRQFYAQTLARGYLGARVSGEMSWATRAVVGSERLAEYEALVNHVLVEHPVTAICQYDVNLFDGRTILDILKVHPMMIVRGQVVVNPYYLEPEEFLAQQVRNVQ